MIDFVLSSCISGVGMVVLVFVLCLCLCVYGDVICICNGVDVCVRGRCWQVCHVNVEKCGREYPPLWYSRFYVAV